jgi:NF-X1-type zinc finger protein NFXL1
MPKRVAMSNSVSPAFTVYVWVSGSPEGCADAVAVGNGLGADVAVRVGVIGAGVSVSVATGVSEGIGVMVGVGVRLGVGVKVGV